MQGHTLNHAAQAVKRRFAMDEMRKFLVEAAHVTPSDRQMKWYDRELYAFVHF